jgi:hypothetical protein
MFHLFNAPTHSEADLNASPAGALSGDSVVFLTDGFDISVLLNGSCFTTHLKINAMDATYGKQWLKMPPPINLLFRSVQDGKMRTILTMGERLKRIDLTQGT